MERNFVVTGFCSGPGAEHHVSFGLVRVANIRPAIDVSQYLAARLPNARIVCYHAKHFPMQRFYVEHKLDALLRRSDGDDHFWRDAEVTTAIADNQAAGRAETLFIVVATPVEEIGRDHDFDWAVIEPSSTQSIVQTAGRVNRHRRVTVTEPNIALLQFNFKAIQGKDYVFEKPGLESGLSHPDHDLATLLDWSNGIKQIDVRLRMYHRHKFAKYDDDALKTQTTRPFNRFSGKSSAGMH